MDKSAIRESDRVHARPAIKRADMQDPIRLPDTSWHHRRLPVPTV